MNIIVSFSGRKCGNCGKIADFCGDFLPDVQIFRFSDFSIQPCGRCDCECFREREACPYFNDMEYRLLDTITHSNQAVFIVPNYCDYPNGNFFIFNERSQCYFQGHPELLALYLKVAKKFIVISNTSQVNFREAFTQHVDIEPNVLFLSAKALGKSSIAGDILKVKEAVMSIERFLNNE